MRFATVSLIVVAAGIFVPSPSSAAEDGCQWLPGPGVAPITRKRDDLRYQRFLQCQGEAGGELQIQIYSGSDGKMVLQGSKDDKVKPYREVVGLERRVEKRLELRAGIEKLCRVEPAAKSPVVLVGRGFEQRVGFPVTVRFDFVGQGALAPLNRSDTFEITCPRCNSKKPGSIWIATDRGQRVGTGAKIMAKLDPSWFACARKKATLEIRLFAIDGERNRYEPIEPVMVVRGLEKKLRRQGDSVVMEVPLNVAPLCRTGKPWIVWEAWGEGELKAAGKGRHASRIGC